MNNPDQERFHRSQVFVGRSGALLRAGLATIVGVAGYSYELLLRGGCEVSAGIGLTLRAIGVQNIPRWVLNDEAARRRQETRHSSLDAVHDNERFSRLKRRIAHTRGGLDTIWSLYASSKAVVRIADVDKIKAADIKSGHKERKQSGKSTIFAFAHTNSLPALAHLITATDTPFTLVAAKMSSEKKTPDWYHRLSPMSRLRYTIDVQVQALKEKLYDAGTARIARRAGAELILVDPTSGSEVLRACQAATSKGRAVLIGADVYVGKPKRGGIEVDIAGSTRLHGPGPALLSIKTGSPVVVVGVFQTVSGQRLGLSEMIQPPQAERRELREATVRMTQEIGVQLSSVLAAQPSQWELADAPAVAAAMLELHRNPPSAERADVATDANQHTQPAQSPTPIPARPTAMDHSPSPTRSQGNYL